VQGTWSESARVLSPVRRSVQRRRAMVSCSRTVGMGRRLGCPLFSVYEYENSVNLGLERGLLRTRATTIAYTDRPVRYGEQDTFDMNKSDPFAFFLNNTPRPLLARDVSVRGVASD
jgi:hypothetical protein